MIYFVRHGQSEYNLKKLYTGTIDVPLTELGIKQARETGLLLAGKGITIIISSDLSRAAETARKIQTVIDPNQTISIETSALLREADFGDIQGQEYIGVSGLEYGVTSKTGESASQLYDRGLKALDLIKSFETGGNLLVVGHGSFTSVIFAINQGLSSNDLVNFRRNWSFQNGEVKELI